VAKVGVVFGPVAGATTSGGGLGLVACTVFKTVGRRPRRLRWVRFPHAPAIVLIAVCSVWPSRSASAQVVPLPTPTRQPKDTIPVEPFRVRPPVSPMSAMLRSLVLPGWGQSVLDRRVTGAVFVFWEGITLGMTLKSAHQLTYLRRVNDPDAEIIESKKNEIQDWAVLLVFNHLMSAAEAFVAANLWDFPKEVALRPLPHGAFGLTVTLTLP
jgi:hypothetical protein